MMGMQAAPEQFFYDFCLEDHVPGDHMLRRIDDFLDLDDIRRELKPFYCTIGRPSVDPALMIRMLVIGYCFGIRSERRLCEEVHLNLAYRWFCRLGLDCSAAPCGDRLGTTPNGSPVRIAALQIGVKSHRWLALGGPVWRHISHFEGLHYGFGYHCNRSADTKFRELQAQQARAANGNWGGVGDDVGHGVLLLLPECQRFPFRSLART